MLRAEAPAFAPSVVLDKPAVVASPWIKADAVAQAFQHGNRSDATASLLFQSGSPPAGAIKPTFLMPDAQVVNASLKEEVVGQELEKSSWGDDAEFKLSGLEDLQKSLASLLTGKLKLQQPTADSVSTSTSCSGSTPGSSTPTCPESTPKSQGPPSLDGEDSQEERAPLAAPPGFEEEKPLVITPPGLEEYTANVAKTEEEVAIATAEATEISASVDKEEDAPIQAAAWALDKEALPPLPARKKRPSVPVSNSDLAATTTFILHQLPKRCSRDLLLTHLERAGFQEEIDFLYLPVDLKTMSNIGHAALNFKSEEAAGRFCQAFHGAIVKDIFQGCGGAIPKGRCEVVAAKVQGLEPNVQKLRQSGLLMSMLAGKPAWLPLVRDEEDLLVPLPDQAEGSD